MIKREDIEIGKSFQNKKTGWVITVTGFRSFDSVLLYHKWSGRVTSKLIHHFAQEYKEMEW